MTKQLSVNVGSSAPSHLFGLCNQCGVNQRRPGQGCKYCEACSSSLLCSTCRLEPRLTGARNTQCAGCRKASVDAFNNVVGEARRAGGVCPRCGKLPPQAGMQRCVNCYAKRKGEGRIERASVKAKSVAYKGGACLDCALVTPYLNVYDFHHRDPSEKDFNLAQAYSHYVDWSVVQAELDKCDLLCSNCHRIRHAKLRGKANKQTIQ